MEFAKNADILPTRSKMTGVIFFQVAVSCSLFRFFNRREKGCAPLKQVTALQVGVDPVTSSLAVVVGWFQFSSPRS